MKNIKCYIKTGFNCILILCLLFSGCKAAAEAQSTPAPIALPTPIPSPLPEIGGELLLPMPRNPFKTKDGSALTPFSINTEEMRSLYSLIYDQLLGCDANNRIVPALVEKWSSDQQGKVYTLYLRENVLWHDGSGILKASEVKDAIEYILATGESSFYYSQLYQAVETVEAQDDKTLIITMKRAGSASLYALTFPVVRVSELTSLNGTGPYRLSNNTQTVVELTANTQWWRQTPYIATVRFLARESNDVALDSFDAGQLNMVVTGNVSAGKHREEGVTNVLDVYTQDCEALLFNHTRSRLGSIEMRQAILYAIDRSAIVANVYMNRAAISDVPVPPDSFMYDPTSKIYDYSQTKARELLAALGWVDKDAEGFLIKNGQKLSFKLLVNESTESTYRKNVAAMIASQLKTVGIEIIVETEKYSIDTAENPFMARLQSGNFDLALIGFNLERSGNLMPYIAAGGSRNYGGYGNGELTSLLENAAAALDEKDVREKHAAFQQAFVKELPFLTLYFRLNSLVYSASIKNVTDVRGPEFLRTAYRWYINETRVE